MNFTINSREQCSAAVMIGQSNGLGLVMIVQIFLSIITLAQICRCIRLVRTKKLHLHANLRLLMFCGLIGYIHVSIYTSLYPIFFLMHRIKHVEPCDLVYEKLTCYILRWPLYYGVVYQSFLHLAISIERTMATRFMHTYDKGFLWWGRGIAACSIIGAVTMASLILAPDETNRHFTFCNITNTSNQFEMKCGLIIMLSIDLVAVLTDITLYYVNHRTRVNRLADVPREYTLSWSYQLTENNSSTKIVLPVTIAQSSCYLMYNITSFIGRQFFTINEIGFYAITNTCFYFFQLGLLLATFAFYNNYLNSYNTRQKQLKKNQASQDYFVLFQSQLEEAYKKRLISSPMSRPKPKPAGRSPVFNAVLA